MEGAFYRCRRGPTPAPFAFVHVPMGTLTDAPSMRPTKHIFVGDKADWHEITDDLPQYAANAPGN
jgi:hypothetical protein